MRNLKSVVVLKKKSEVYGDLALIINICISVLTALFVYKSVKSETGIGLELIVFLTLSVISIVLLSVRKMNIWAMILWTVSILIAICLLGLSSENLLKIQQFDNALICLLIYSTIEFILVFSSINAKFMGQ